MEWAHLPQILGVYETALRALQVDWSGPSRIDPNPRFLDHEERHASARVVGSTRYYARRRARHDAIFATARKIIPQNVLPYQPSNKKVRAWINLNSPSAVAHELLADVFNELRNRSPQVLLALELEPPPGRRASASFTAKSIRGLLTRARHQRREAAKIHVSADDGQI
jgi:hypothetical protein